MLKLKIVKWQGCVLWGKKGQEGNVQQRAGQGRCDVDPTAEMLAVLVTGGKEGVGLGAGLAACVGHPSSSCLRSGFLFGELADDTNERSVLVLQPLIVRLQLRQNLRKDKDEAGLQLGRMAKKNPAAPRKTSRDGVASSARVLLPRAALLLVPCSAPRGGHGSCGVAVGHGAQQSPRGKRCPSPCPRSAPGWGSRNHF